MPRTDALVELSPRVLRWARERARLSSELLAHRAGVPRDEVDQWERTGLVGVRRAERIAQATRTPLGYLYLQEPPIDQLPLPDFRALHDEVPESPSPELLDVIVDAARRVEWYRGFVIRGGAPRPDFVGVLRPDTNVATAADRIRTKHGLTTDLRARASSWEEALRFEVDRLEATGILVTRNGVVGNNTHRPLDVEEFRAFAIADEYAPLIFLNARDAKAAQMFSLMHELVHIWLGQSAVTNLKLTIPSAEGHERFTNSVAAEVLMPEAELRDAWRRNGGAENPVLAIARQFKVSTLVVLRRLYDIDSLTWETFRERYVAEEEAFARRGPQGDDSGGDFYRTQTVRSSRRLATAVIQETLEGRTSWREAFQLLGLKSSSTFEEFARRLGFPVA
jgi:Zn-dependent peptidase ImmA (M78 family)/transcriptional regulator with XRE-family HTH domain